MEQSKEQEIKAAVKSKFTWLSNEDINHAFNIALSDYLLYKYPSENNRPTPENLEVTFVIQQWIIERMEDVLDRAGGNYLSYSENGLSWTYAQSHIDRALVAKLMPKAATPQ